uniref:Translocase of outer mitochondrial membrane 5 homolog n=1 Tax=Pan troglodytes TaxID=9598 RepID=K7DTI1_PANTR
MKRKMHEDMISIQNPSGREAATVESRARRLEAAKSEPRCSGLRASRRSWTRRR